ncbi:Uncharacterised protein [uncultured archaeon]|nr:Uncharacterised protein [uncultured archaeon]
MKNPGNREIRIVSKALIIASLIFISLAAGAVAASITFDKSLDVPDRDFTVTYEGSTFSFRIADIGDYKIGEDIGVTVTGGVSNMRLVLFTVDKITPWFKSFYATSGSISTKIPADRFDPNCSDVCDDGNGGYKMGPGIYALVVQDRDNNKYFIAKPVVVSDYDMAVTTNTAQVSPKGTIKVSVNVFKNGNPVSVGSNNIKVEFVQDLTRTHFNSNAQAIATGVYEANVQVPANASGDYRLYAAIITNRNIYQDYPETIGAASYSGTVTVSGAEPTPTPAATYSEGGGGSGGDISGEEFKNIESVERYEKYISKNVPASYVFRQQGNPINEIIITSNTNAGDIAVKTEILSTQSSLTNSPPPGLVYKNINILVGTSGFAVPKNIKEATIKFKVENSWLDNNSLENRDITMDRWDGSKWIILETGEKTNDSTYTYYEAKTDSFSPFVITGIKSVTMPAATPEIVETTSPVQTSTATLTSTTTPAAGMTEKVGGFGKVLVIIAFSIVYALGRKKN